LNTPATPQRRWRAACPNCGAPVEFASAASPVAVCGFCRSTLARDGEALRRIGASAELFDDHSPLQLGAAGRWQGVAFTVLGRLQLAYEGGRWNEWHVLFDGGRSAWLAEDNGRYVMAMPQQAAPPGLPARELLLPGAALALDGRDWRVAAVVAARIEAAQGELPSVPRLGEPVQVVELRSTGGEVGSLEFGASGPPAWTIGRAAALADLALTGLREAVDAELASRTLECPSCGASLEIKLASTRSIACHQCHAVVDVSKGLGAELTHHEQQAGAAEGGGPQIPLGATGRLDLGEGPQDWQVVGYQVRRTEPKPGGDDGDEDEDGYDEVYFWREYLLYSRAVGFAFLVDAADGWSWAVPVTGVPRVRGEQAQWQGRSYRQTEAYASRTTWVLGEFYWRVRLEDRTQHVDYRAGPRRLNREQTTDEVTWSEGDSLDASTLARAFSLPAAAHAALRPAVPAFKADAGSGALFVRIAVGLLVLFIVVAAVRQCSRDDCAEVRATFGPESREAQQCRERGRYAHSNSGGSYGGSSGGGGGHK
jgi:hypothetical protein